MSLNDRKIGIATDSNGDDYGKLPQDMTPEGWSTLGHSKKNIMRVIRGFCVECSGGSESEARKCTAVECQLWPYRMGKNPFRVISEAQRRGFNR